MSAFSFRPSMLILGAAAVSVIATPILGPRTESEDYEGGFLSRTQSKLFPSSDSITYFRPSPMTKSAVALVQILERDNGRTLEVRMLGPEYADVAEKVIKYAGCEQTSGFSSQEDQPGVYTTEVETPFCLKFSKEHQ